MPRNSICSIERMNKELAQDTTVADMAAEATQESTPAKSLHDASVAETSASERSAGLEFKNTFLVLYSVSSQTFDILGAAEFLRHHHHCFMEGRPSTVVIESMHATSEAALAHMKGLQIPG